MTEREFETGYPKTARIVATTSFVEGVAGLCAIALGIIGLAGSYANAMAGVAIIVLGCALLFETGAISARYSSFATEMGTDSYTVSWASGAGVLGGIAGIALGILALLHVAPTVLIPVAILGFGFCHLVHNVSHTRLYGLESEKYASHRAGEEMFRDSSIASHGVQTIAGLAAVALGIIALSGVNPMVLCLVAIIGLGSAFLLNGSVVGSKMLVLSRT
jgi:hypothetical protein